MLVAVRFRDFDSQLVLLSVFLVIHPLFPKPLVICDTSGSKIKMLLRKSKYVVFIA